MTNSRARTARRILAALLAISCVALLPGTANADPKSDRERRIEEFRAKVEAARIQLDALTDRAEFLDEEFLLARLDLERAEARLVGATTTADNARRDARAARDLVASRVKAAYLATGSSLAILLGSSTYTEFSDRLEFLDQIARADADAVALADVAGRRSVWATAARAQAVQERTNAVEAVESKRAELEGVIEEQETLLAGFEEELRIALIPPPPPDPPEPPVLEPTTVETQPEEPPAEDPAAEEPPAEEPPVEETTDPAEEEPEAPPEDPAEDEDPVVEDPPEEDGGSAPPNPEPPAPGPSSGVPAVLDAAYSQIGVPWVYAGDSPEEGFDCSGFTMWSWAHAGVSLPHSSAMQYSVLPHVDRSELQPGDLLFFYSPIHHVAIYVGGGSMIHSPGSGRYVRVEPVYWQYYVGAGRPG